MFKTFTYFIFISNLVFLGSYIGANHSPLHLALATRHWLGPHPLLLLAKPCHSQPKCSHASVLKEDSRWTSSHLVTHNCSGINGNDAHLAAHTQPGASANVKELGRRRCYSGNEWNLHYSDWIQKGNQLGQCFLHSTHRWTLLVVTRGILLVGVTPNETAGPHSIQLAARSNSMNPSFAYV